MKFTELKKHLDEEGVQPIYLLEGEDVYFREKGRDMLKSACLSQPEFNYMLFDKKGNWQALSDAVYTLPFLSEKRIVALQEFYPTEKEYASFLKPLFEKPVDSTVILILNSAKPKAGLCDLKKKPSVCFVDCGKADDATVAKWIFLTLKRAGIRADGSVCNAIQSYCNSDMGRVSKEVEKLIAYASESGVLTLGDVDELIYKDAEYKIYELTQAMARKDYNTFMSIMDSMVGKGFDEAAFLNSFCSYFRTLAEVSESEGSDGKVAEALGMKEFAVKKTRQQAARFPKGAPAQYYADVYTALATARAGEITFPAALKTVIQKIFFKTY